MSTLAGRIALVTGASQGIGRACALELARRGASVALAARNLDKLGEVGAEITAAGGTAPAFALDVASEESIKECAKAVVAHFGAVNILVNNAGITRDILAMRMKRKDWDDVLTTNLTGTFLMTQAVMSQMVKNRWGRIINITSVVGETGQAGQGNHAPPRGGFDRADEIARARVGQPLDYGQCCGAGIYRNGDDCHSDGRTEECHDPAHPSWPGWRRRRYRLCRGVLGFRGDWLHHWPHAGCEWRDVFAVTY